RFDAPAAHGREQADLSRAEHRSFGEYHGAGCDVLALATHPLTRARRPTERHAGMVAADLLGRHDRIGTVRERSAGHDRDAGARADRERLAGPGDDLTDDRKLH